MELVRQKNIATCIVFPIVDADGDIVTGAAGLDSEIDSWSDGAAPDGFADCTNEATEIGTSGVYYLSLSQSEMNADYIYIIVKTSTSGAKTQHILIRTMVGDPLLAATTDDGGTINVASGRVEADVKLIEAADPSDTIRDSIVDDATRIDASALNTLSGKVPSKAYLTGSDNSDGDIEMDEATGNYPGTVATVTNLTNAPANGDLTAAMKLSITAAVPTVAQIQAELEENGASILDTLTDRLTATRAGYIDNLSAGAAALASVCTETRLAELDAANLPADVATIAGYLDTEIAAIKACTDLITAARMGALTDLIDGGRLDLLIDSIITSLTTIAGYLDTEVAAILADTNELQTDLVNGGRLDLLIDSIITAIAALNNVSKAEVNAEVVDALNVDTYAEPGQGAPAATTTLVAKIGYLYKMWRNKKTQTATAKILYNDDGTTAGQKSTVSDDATTFTDGEMGTGA